MNLTGLKELIKKFGAIVIMNGTEPEYVIMPYAHYATLENGAAIPLAEPQARGGMKPLFPAQEVKPSAIEQTDEERVVEMLNKEIMALKEELLQREATADGASPIE